MNELEQWKELTEKGHLYYVDNHDKITRLEAIEERDTILDLCPEAKDLLNYIAIARNKRDEGLITTEECDYIIETRAFPPSKGPTLGGLEFWLCHKCGLILHGTDICPFCEEFCSSGKNTQFCYQKRR